MAAIAKLLGIVVALFAAYVAYWLYQDGAAQSAAEQFCGAIAIGSPASDAIARAKAAGRRVIERTEGPAFHFQGPVFNAHLCELTVVDGKILRREVRKMDD